MKKLLIAGTFLILCTTLFSCTADEYETSAKNEIKKIADPIADGPDDGPIVVPPPPTKD